MNNNESSICAGCMSQLEAESVCPYCGYDNNQPYDESYRRPGSVLGGRYVVGALRHKNGEGARYIGYDNNLAKVVWITEYFPSSIASRDPLTGDIAPLEGYGAQYKALMSDFADVCNEVRRLSVSDMVIPIDNVVSENNTIYAIYRDMGCRSLEEYLASQGGKLPLATALELLLPLCNTVSNMHDRGVIHRGISPQTIYIGEEEKLYLGGFSLSATRTGDSELEAELFNGYSAPEQYVSNGWQGTWTDVYAMAAVLYRTVSGFVPPKSVLISEDRPVAPLADLVLDMPLQISDAVQEAMVISTEGRTQAMSVFTAGLISTQVSSTSIFETGRAVARGKAIQSAQEGASSMNKRRRRGQSGSLHMVKYVSLALVLTFVVLGGVIWAVMGTYLSDLTRVSGSTIQDGSSRDSQNSGDLSALVDGEEITVPDFSGMTFEEILANTRYQELFQFVTEEGHSDSYSEGQVYGQTPAAGTPVTNRYTILLNISKGKQTTPMPDLTGLTLEDAEKAITRLGEELDTDIPFQVLRRYNGSAEPNTVISTSPVGGDSYDPQADTIYLYVTPDKDESSGASESSEVPEAVSIPSESTQSSQSSQSTQSSQSGTQSSRSQPYLRDPRGNSEIDTDLPRR